MEKRRDIDIAIGKKMAELRNKMNLTQKEACQVLAINTSTYKHYELGDRAIPIFVLSYISKFYKVPFNYFIEEIPDTGENLRDIYRYKESLERQSNANNIGIISDPKIIKKYFDDIEDKIQARARLRIKNLRLENNKLQKDIATYLDIDVSTYNKYEKGTRNLSVEVIGKIAEYYNISVSDLLD
ncbi:MAG: helix-turn-helix transcriptional regulator [Clostridia bacterium]